IEKIVEGSIQKGYSCYEEVVYLLLFGELPDEEQLRSLKAMLAKYRTLPTNFVRDIIMKAPSRDMMNTLARSILTLYSYDDKGDDISIPNV
ncbi:MAG TPA: citrate synthase, partial [Clostridiales bacterium]|nr:citrate synthase [Clostridiales bacterium]